MAAAPVEKTPFVVSVVLEIEEDRVPAFLEAMKIDVEGSRQEEGCLRFDLLQDRDQPNKFIFYEAYQDEEALKIHKETPHYKAWADFKNEGGVISQVAMKCNGINFQG